MRQGQNSAKRGRGRGRRPTNTGNRSYESNGPDVKVRGNAAAIVEKYQTLARDASSAGDRVMAENYSQHAEHYQRLLNSAAQANAEREAEREAQQPSGQENNGNNSNNGNGSNNSNNPNNYDNRDNRINRDNQDNQALAPEARETTAESQPESDIEIKADAPEAAAPVAEEKPKRKPRKPRKPKVVVEDAEAGGDDTPPAEAAE